MLGSVMVAFAWPNKGGMCLAQNGGMCLAQNGGMCLAQQWWHVIGSTMVARDWMKGLKKLLVPESHDDRLSILTPGGKLAVVEL